MITNIQLFSEGGQGLIFKTNSTYATKVGMNNDIMTEYTNIQRLPINLGCFYDISLVQIDSLHQEEIDYLLKYYDKTILVSYAINHNQTNEMSKLYMPFIEHPTFEKCIVKKYQCYKSEYRHNASLDIIVLNHWVNICKAMIELYNTVCELNNTYKLFHNDLSSCNILYDENQNKFYIIDFGMMSFDTDRRDDGYKEDMLSIAQLMTYMLNIGIANSNILQQLLTYIEFDTIYTAIISYGTKFEDIYNIIKPCLVC